VSRAILLDAGPLGRLANPLASASTVEANRWLEALVTAGEQPIVPEIADYEVRRELLRGRRHQSVSRLDALKRQLGYLPLTTEMMLTAAEFWARARMQGTPTAANAALDADVILAAQATALADEGAYDAVVVATTNVGHLLLFVDARLWTEITP
jgi:predicted nucleic acid-binding protein